MTGTALTSVAEDVIDRDNARFARKITFTLNLNESLIVLANKSN
jgi:hypothetical protein